MKVAEKRKAEVKLGALRLVDPVGPVGSVLQAALFGEGGKRWPFIVLENLLANVTPTEL